MPDPNNLLIPEDKVAFQLICKAANTTIKHKLGELFYPGKEGSVVKRPKEFFTFVSKEKIPEGYLVVGFCRHPEDRLISCWKDKICREELHRGFKKYSGLFYARMPFDDFVKAVSLIPDGPECDQHFRSQTYDLLPLEKIDFLIFTETLSTSWKQVGTALGVRSGRDYGAIVTTKNSSKGENPEITKELRSLIFNRYENDYRKLKYSM